MSGGSTLCRSNSSSMEWSGSNRSARAEAMDGYHIMEVSLHRSLESPSPIHYTIFNNYSCHPLIIHPLSLFSSHLKQLHPPFTFIILEKIVIFEKFDIIR